MDKAVRTLGESRAAVRAFESTQFTSLASQEQTLVNPMQRDSDRKEAQFRAKLVLANLRDKIQDTSIDDADLGAVLAQLPPNTTNQEVRKSITGLQAEQAALRVMLHERRLAEGSARVAAVRAEIVELQSQLATAATASLEHVERRLTLLASQEEELRAQRAQFPGLESELLALAARTRIDLEAYQFILSQLYQAQITGLADPAYVEIVDPASGAAAIRGARGAVNLVLAALLGLVLGLGAVFSLPLLNRAAVQADRRWLDKPF